MADNKKTDTSIVATSDNTKKLAAVSKATLSIEEQQLEILKDISKLVKNISDNIFAGLVVTLPPEAMELLAAPPKVNALAEKEKEKEALLAGTEGAKEQAKEKLETPFKGILTTLKLILTPMILGFVIGLRRKFDLLSVALTIAIMNPIKSLMLLWKSFKFAIGKVYDFLKENRIFIFIRNKLFGPLLAMFMKVEEIMQGERVAKAISSAKKIISTVSKFIQPIKEFFTTLFEPIKWMFESGSKLKGLMNNKAISWIARIGTKGLKAIPVIGWIITIIEGLVGAVSGGMEGFEKGGIKGMIRGAMVGLVDGLVGWIVDIGKWIVSGLLDLFGFEDMAKIVEEFDFKEFLDKYLGFFMPIVGLIDLFDENSEIRKMLSEGIDKLSDLGSTTSDFFEEILDALVESFKNILINIGKAIPGGEWLLDKLGVKESKINAQNIAVAREAAARTAAEEGRSEEEIQAIRAATTAEELRAAAPATIGDRAKAAATNPLTRIPIPIVQAIGVGLGAMTAESDEIKAAESAAAGITPAPASTQQRAQEALDRETRENKDLAAAPPKPPAPVSSTSVAVDNSSRQQVTYNRELHAAKDRGFPSIARASPI